MSDWTAVLIDTNIFIKTNYNFDGGHLERMKSFRHRPENIIFDDIVYGEVVSNFSKHLLERSRALKKANKEAWLGKLIGLPQKKLIEDLCVTDTASQEKAKDYLDCYIEECGAVRIRTHFFSNLEKVIEDYFLSKPPFGVKEIKKNEFPDALCLNAVNAWAVAENQKVILVSEDKDWADYAQLSEGRLKVVPSISKALDIFQEFDSKVFYSNVVRKQWDSIAGQIESSIEQALFSEVVEGAADIEASSFLHFDSGIEDAEIESISFFKNGSELDVDLIETSEFGFGESFYVSLTAQINYSVSAIFDFSAYDSIDRDMVHLGGVVESVDCVDNIEIIARLSLEDDSLVFCSAEVNGLPRVIYFGDVEPDFRD